MKTEQERVAELYARRRWKNEKPLSAVGRLSAGVANLAEEMNGEPGELRRRNVEHALGHMLFIIAAIANAEKVDLDRAFEIGVSKVESP